MTQVLLEIPDSYSERLQIQARVKQKKVQDIILDAIRNVATEGWVQYLSEFPHYILFVSAFVQAWFLGTTKPNPPSFS